jgi:hypothetical protein
VGTHAVLFQANPLGHLLEIGEQVPLLFKYVPLAHLDPSEIQQLLLLSQTMPTGQV